MTRKAAKTAATIGSSDITPIAERGQYEEAHTGNACSSLLKYD